MTSTTPQGKAETIPNAEAIIEAFGGIRPMANIMGIAATTVQGWKKRGVIPMKRKASMLKAAEENNIDLSAMLSGSTAPSLAVVAEAIAPETESVEPETESIEDVPVEDTPVTEEPEQIAAQPETPNFVKPQAPKPQPQVQRSQAPKRPQTDQELLAYAMAVEKKAITKSLWISAVLIIVCVGGAFAILWPRSADQAQRLASLEGNILDVQTDIQEIEEETQKPSFFGNIIPEDLQNQISELKTQAQTTQAQVSSALTKIETISSDFVGEGAGTIEERIQKIDTHINNFTGQQSPLSAMLVKLSALKGSADGQGQIDQAMADLSAVLSNSATQTSQDFNTALDAARTQSTALGETMDDVPKEDLKAAAMLMGMSQFRSALNRDNDSFANDLSVLNSMIGAENTELTNAIERLAPHAQSGVLTASGLSGELKSLAGDAIISSLQGEDVSVQDRAQARFNELFSVEKNGELITGTQTQNALSQAQTTIDSGNIEEAIRMIETIDGPAADVLAPWVGQAKARVIAKQVESMLTDMVRNGGVQSLGDLESLEGLSGALGGGGLSGSSAPAGMPDISKMLNGLNLNGANLNGVQGVDLKSLNLDGLGLEALNPMMKNLNLKDLNLEQLSPQSLGGSLSGGGLGGGQLFQDEATGVTIIGR